MSAALYIIPERAIDGFDPGVNGKALGRSTTLDRLAKQAGVKSLMEFFSQDPEEAAAFLEDQGVEYPTDELPAEQWFTPEEGLATVRGLLGHLAGQPDSIREAAALADDLREFEAVLSRLAVEGVRWHLAVDF